MPEFDEDVWVAALDARLDALPDSPTSTDVMHVTDDYEASTGVAVAVRRALEGGEGDGSLPDPIVVPVTIAPTNVAGIPLKIDGPDNQTADLARIVTGKLRAALTTAVGVDDAELTLTAVAPGIAGRDITITYLALSGDNALAVDVVGTAITVTLETVDPSGGLSTASEVMAAVNGDVAASALVTASLAAGNDGSGLPSNYGPASLENGGEETFAVRVSPAGAVTLAPMHAVSPALTLQAPAGSLEDANSLFAMKDETGLERWDIDAAGHSEYRNGAGGHVAVDPAGYVTVIADLEGFASLGLVNIFDVKADGGSSQLNVPIAGGGHGVRAQPGGVTDASFQAAAITDQTGPLIEARDQDFNQVLKVAPTGAVTVTPSDPDVAGITVANGGIVFPSSDPGVAGAWWDDAGTLTRSAG